MRHLTGLAGLIGALRNMGLLGAGPWGTRGLEWFSAEDGHPVAVCSAGRERPPVVLVHGLGCSHRDWWPVARRLAARHRVLAWDARGHGACRVAQASSITLPQLGRDLAALLAHFELRRAVLVGHSMGALTVLQYLQEFGFSDVSAVALVDQSPRIVTDDEWRLGLFGGCSAAQLTGMIEAARHDLTGTVLRQIESAGGDWLRCRIAPDALLGKWLRAWLTGIDVQPLLDLAQSMVEADFRPVLARLDLPLWVALGARSPHYRDVPLADWYRRTVPHARISVYARAGHSPHYSEPLRFALELQQFLDEHAW